MNRNDLIFDIEASFGGVLLEDGIGIYEAEAIDNYAKKNEIKRERARDRSSWNDWEDIPDQIIDRYHSVLCFVDPIGMKFILPAFMRFSVKNYDKGGSAAVDSTIYALDRGIDSFGGDDSVLSDRQKSVIAKFFTYMVLEAEESHVDSSVASRAYDQHWSQHE